MLKIYIITKTRELYIKRIKKPEKTIKDGLFKFNNNNYLILPEEIFRHHKRNIFDKDYDCVIKSEGKIVGARFDKDGNIINDTPYLTNVSSPQDNIFQILLNSKVTKEFVQIEEKQDFNMITLIIGGVGLMFGIIIGLAIAGVRL